MVSYIFIVILYVRMIKAESGEGDPMEDNNGDGVEIKEKPKNVVLQ